MLADDASERSQKVGHCSELVVLEQPGAFIMKHLQRYGASEFYQGVGFYDS
jgi:hypothetical protein